MRSLKNRIVLLLVTLLVIVRLGHMAVNQSFYGPGPLQISRTLVIPPGTTKNVAAVLHQDGVITYPLVFWAAAWATRDQGPIHAGEFFFPAHVSLAVVLAILRHGVPVQHQVTIPEGLTGAQIAAILNATPDATGHVAPPPEGGILPQTYDFTLGTSRQAILARAEKALQNSLSTAWAKRNPSIPLQSPQQALILASIVQQESPIAAELPKIAAVYENRLTLGMKLQADPTVIYAASGGKDSGGVQISRADLANPSPYNTYVQAGLPPSPICAPGIAAIEAVLHPAASKALYFVATGNGGHVFADNFKQQLQNIDVYRASQKQ